MSVQVTQTGTILLPHSKEAEEHLLGQILIEPSIITKVLSYIPEEDVFYGETTRELWKIIFNLHKKRDNINIATVCDNIPKSKRKQIQFYYVDGLQDNIPSVSSAESYAKLIYEKWLLRQVFIQTKKIEQAINENTNDANKILQKVHTTIGRIINLKPSERFDIKELLQETIEKIKDETGTIRFGLGKLDSITGGMTRGEISVFAGRPSMGKTTCAINVLMRLIESGNRVVVFNREMTNIEVMRKMLAIESERLSYRALRFNDLDTAEWKEINRIKKMFENKFENLLMFDNIRDLHRGTREIKKFKPDVIIDDYIQMVRVPNVEDKRHQIIELLHHYKWLAKSENCAVLLLSQLNRNIEYRAKKSFVLSDLSESGSIEQDAEAVIFINYPWKDKEPHEQYDNEEKYTIKLRVGKNRYGETGEAKMGFLGDRCLITETPESAIRGSKILEEYRNGR